MTATTPTLPAEIDVAVVGSGFSGLGMAAKLKQEGVEDFVVLERGDDVGGTWHWNTYPGCGCDVPSNLYSFSWAPNPDWTHTYSRQPEIRSYLRNVADTFGLRPHVVTGCSVTDAAWDETTGRWTVETSQGTLSARVLVAAAGPLFEPKTPDVPGLDEFEGAVFHSARWDHDYDVRGKRIAAVGTGASAIQFVPEIAPDVERLHVFQRTPPWVMPHPGRPTTRLERLAYKRFPALQKLSRGAVYAAREWLVLGFVKEPRIMKLVERIARHHMRRSIADPALIEKVSPDYTIGCKRILPSNKWYPALDRDNVDLHTGGLQRATRTGVVDADGIEHAVDAIVFGTGFRVTDAPIAHHLRGAGGQTLAERWGQSMHAHRGCTIPGFPNLFFLLGPNTGLGHGSMVYMIESQVQYVISALRRMRERGAEVAEVRADAEAAYNRDVDRRLEGTVWNTGCASWYADESGRIATLWPDWTFAFRRAPAGVRRRQLRAHQPAARAGVRRRLAGR